MFHGRYPIAGYWKMNTPQGRELEGMVPEWIKPQWPAPSHVRAYVTTRAGSINSPPYEGFNVADHVGDDLDVVMYNRHMLQEYFGWASQPCWLNQVHGTDVHERLLEASPGSLSRPLLGKALNIDADACVTDVLSAPCAIHTADCLPVFFTNEKGSKVALAHAGWRGLLEGVLENTLACD
jgi:copper oxidase (laccase) domain-containing protein